LIDSGEGRVLARNEWIIPNKYGWMAGGFKGSFQREVIDREVGG
jgi:hypothetical protein